MNKLLRKIRAFISCFVRKRNLNQLVDTEFKYLINRHGIEYKEGHLLKRIMLEYHVIEKGLTMPNMRLGFGEKILVTLISDIKIYIELYGNNDEQVKTAINVVSEYDRIHKESSFTLSEDVQNAIDTVLKYFDSNNQSSQPSMTKDVFFSHVNDSFESFSSSRHSVRYFNGAVDINTLKKALEMAQTAPSACNRQSTRIKVITDKALVQKVFSIQHGNRGFGNLVENLIVLTTDLQYWDISTYWGGYVDGGIYAMNLLYALHYNKIAACPLNANLNVSESKAIKSLLNIPNNENIFLFIAIGDVPDSFKLTRSYRSNFNKVTTII